jgi:2-polyprenyl-3-methyl-5-hydroxy-6-metoxy-1,4-benzoquinol methylase
MKCRVCQGKDIRIIDRIASPNCDQPVPVCHCRRCHHFSLFPDQYQGQKAFEWDGVNYYLDGLERRKSVSAQLIGRLIRAYRLANGSRPESFLDAGCALGWSLAEARRQGLEPVGVEPEIRLADYGRATFGVDIRHGKLSKTDLGTKQFDLVYCEQVLEHVQAPADFLGQLAGLLAPCGQMYIGVPPLFPLNRMTTHAIRKLNLVAADTPLSNVFHDPDEHISVFSGRSMRTLARNQGLEIRPLPLAGAPLKPGRLARQLLALGANPGTWLLTHMAQAGNGVSRLAPNRIR